MGDSRDIDERRRSLASLVSTWEVPLIPLLERSCSDCGALGETGRRRQGKFRRVLSETW